MIDINELRRLALDGDLAAMQEIILRLAAAEKDAALKERVIDALGSELNAVGNECDTLRTALGKTADWDSAWDRIQRQTRRGLRWL